MFASTSKGKLIGWSIFWFSLMLICWTADTWGSRIVAIPCLLVALVLLSAAKDKIDRDAGYREQQHSEPPLSIQPPKTSPESNDFGPPFDL
jgi:hypothetical protein